MTSTSHTLQISNNARLIITDTVNTRIGGLIELQSNAVMNAARAQLIGDIQLRAPSGSGGVLNGALYSTVPVQIHIPDADSNPVLMATTTSSISIGLIHAAATLQIGRSMDVFGVSAFSGGITVCTFHVSLLPCCFPRLFHGSSLCVRVVL